MSTPTPTTPHSSARNDLFTQLHDALYKISPAGLRDIVEAVLCALLRHRVIRITNAHSAPHPPAGQATACTACSFVHSHAAGCAYRMDGSPFSFALKPPKASRFAELFVATPRLCNTLEQQERLTAQIKEGEPYRSRIHHTYWNSILLPSNPDIRVEAKRLLAEQSLCVSIRELASAQDIQTLAQATEPVDPWSRLATDPVRELRTHDAATRQAAALTYAFLRRWAQTAFAAMLSLEQLWEIVELRLIAYPSFVVLQQEAERVALRAAKEPPQFLDPALTRGAQMQLFVD